MKEINEVSKQTLQSYVTKAKADPSFEVKKGKVPAWKQAIRAKRTKGIGSATEKLKAIAQKESEKHMKEMKGWHADLHEHFLKEAPKTLKKHGYHLASSSEHMDTYIRPHESGNINAVTIKKTNDHDNFWPGTHRHTNSTGWSGGSDNNHRTIYSQEEYHKAKKEMMPKFEAKLIDNHNHYHMNESEEVQTDTDEVLEEELIDEGRGKKGMARHTKDEDEWGGKEKSKKSFKSFLKHARRQKESMHESAKELGE